MLATAAILFGLMAFLAKLAMARLPGPEVAFVRFAIGLACVAIAGATVLRLRMVSLRHLAMRGVFGGLAVLLYFQAIEHLPVGTATLLNYTAPVFAAVFAAIFLGEAVPRVTAIALSLTFLGVVLVVTGQAPPGRFGFGRWELCGVASAILSGAAITTIRAARRTDGSWEIFGAFCLFGALSTLPFAAPRWVWPDARETWLLVAVGLTSVLAQVLFTAALRHVRAAAAGVMSQLTPVTALGLGVLLGGEPVTPLSLFGASLTVGGVAWAAWAARERELPRT